MDESVPKNLTAFTMTVHVSRHCDLAKQSKLLYACPYEIFIVTIVANVHKKIIFPNARDKKRQDGNDNPRNNQNNPALKFVQGGNHFFGAFPCRRQTDEHRKYQRAHHRQDRRYFEVEQHFGQRLMCTCFAHDMQVRQVLIFQESIVEMK